MANKLQYVSQLADQTAKAVTRNADGWKSYLITASRLYKCCYPFFLTHNYHGCLSQN